MTKKKIIVYFSLAVLIIAGIVFIQIKKIKAQETTSTTFPVDEAGIAAYVEAKNITVEKLSKVPFETIEKRDETFVYGKIQKYILGEGEAPHVYIGLDGWIVAYFLREEPVSKMVNVNWKGWPQWKAYLNPNSLEIVISNLCTQLKLDCSSQIKYYDFEFPEANKMTIIGHCAGWGCASSQRNFLVSISGKLFEASYAIRIGANATYSLSAELDGQKVFEKRFETINKANFFEEFLTSIFKDDGTSATKIIFTKESSTNSYETGTLGLVLIYRE